MYFHLMYMVLYAMVLHAPNSPWWLSGLATAGMLQQTVLFAKKVWTQ